MDKKIKDIAGVLPAVSGPSPLFSAPDYSDRETALSANGSMTVDANGYVQHQFEVTNDTGWYKSILTVNGVTVNAVTIPNTVATGIYDYAGQLIPVLAGDIVTVSLTYSGGTVVNYNYLYFYPLRG